MKSGLPKLREMRTACEMTQAELAERAGITQPTVSDIESGKQQMASFATLRQLAKALGVDVGALF